MYCHACGSALSRQTKYCSRCGAKLDREQTAATKTDAERFDEYVEGLFWITLVGLGCIVGGAIALKIFKFNWEWIIGYVALSSAAFLFNFGLNLREALRLSRCLKKADSDSLTAERDTNKILPEKGPVLSELAQAGPSSVTDDTTRSFEPIPK
jgi:hypothetical protein